MAICNGSVYAGVFVLWHAGVFVQFIKVDQRVWGGSIAGWRTITEWRNGGFDHILIHTHSVLITSSHAGEALYQIGHY